MRMILRTVFIFTLTATALEGPVQLFARAQIQAVNPQIRHARGQNVVPVYEGWFRTADGRRHVSFGYLNRNTEETVDIPTGPSNKVEPGPPDNGQPTHFVPGRHYGVFSFPVPKETPSTEFSWTLTVHGQRVSVPANLDPAYMIEALKEVGGDSPGNTPPVVKFDTAGPISQGPGGVTVERTGRVAVPLALDAWVTDDGLPARQGSVTPSRRGLSATWSRFRGPGQVSFGRASPEIEHGRATTTVTFSQAGDYVLRLLASDGSSFSAQCCWTNGYVRISVSEDK